MQETFNTQVHPDLVNEKCSLYQDFGWNLLSAQEVVRNLPPKQVGDQIINTTETYSKLTFVREKDKNSPRLTQLQADYEKAVETYQKNQAYIENMEPQLSIKWLIIFILASFAYGIGLIPLAIQLILYFSKLSKYKEQAVGWKANCDNALSEMTQTRNAAKQLVEALPEA